MNLRVDLILASEQRSGSVVSLKSLGRIATILVPLLLIAAFALFFYSGHKMEQDLQELKDNLEITKPQHENALALMEQFSKNREVKEELAGWKSSRLELHKQLVGLVDITPTNVQIRTLSLNTGEDLINDRIPYRSYSCKITGRAVNRDAEVSVKRFVDQLQNATPYAGVVSNITWDGKADPAPTAKRTDRIFELSAEYFDRRFK